MTGNNLNLDLVIINAYTKYGQVLSIWSKDIELKQNLTNQGPYLCYKLELWQNPTFSSAIALFM